MLLATVWQRFIYGTPALLTLSGISPRTFLRKTGYLKSTYGRKREFRAVGTFYRKTTLMQGEKIFMRRIAYTVQALLSSWGLIQPGLYMEVL
jgi:hypothetical protein